MNSKWKRYGSLLIAKQHFVDALTRSSVNHIVVRPTGYFSDMTELFEMARKERMYLIGNGNVQMNPIHGSDLAKFCVQSFTKSNQIIDVGGPELLTYNQIARIAFEALNKEERVTHIPTLLLKPIGFGLKPFSKQNDGLFQFFINIMTYNLVAPTYGEIKLKDYYHDIVS